MPCFNSSETIKQSIQSVINQSYKNWELLIIDDHSKDDTKEIIDQYLVLENRIKFFKTPIASGSPVAPRNIGIDNAIGRYIAFLDSDDLWHEDKLKKQLIYFQDRSVAVVFSNYEKITENGESNNRLINARKVASYNTLLYGNIIACSTAVYDTSKVGKMYFKNTGHEDFALWLSILKKGFVAKNSNLNLMKYRVSRNSISSNKFRAIIWNFSIFRKHEELNLFRALFFTSITLFRAFLKYLK